MANTSAIKSTVPQAQEEEFVANVTHDIDYVTTFSDDFDWDSWMTELSMNSVYKASLFIVDYYPFILSAIGVPCNILSFLVLRRIKPLTSALLIMMILSVADSLNLILTVSDVGMRRISISYTSIGCCMLIAARYLVQYMPIWLVVLLTLERVVAVCFPMKAAQTCTISNARRSIVILAIVDLLLCIVHTFIYEEKQVGMRVTCFIKSKYETLFAQWVVFDCIIFVFIQLISLCVSNMAIIVKLRTSTGINNETIGSSISEENKRQNRSVTVMLLAVSITTIICLGPNIACSLFLSNLEASVNVAPSNYARRYLAIWIIMFLTFANNAVNFLLYVLSGRRFRTELYAMIASWVDKIRGHS